MGQFVKQRVAGVWGRRPGGFTLLLAGIGVLAAGLALARQANSGTALWWDSVLYISIADSLLAGDGFTRFDGFALVTYPPFYPILLAASTFGVFEPRDAAGLLNAVIFGLTAFCGGYYLRRRLSPATGIAPLLAAGGALALALSVPLSNSAADGLSESLYMLLALLALIQTDRLLREGRGSALLWAALFTGLAWLTRYTGIALAGWVTLLLLTQPPVAGGGLRKARRIMIYGAIAAAPVGLWILRNVVRFDTATGYRDYTPYPIPELLHLALGVQAEWVFPAPPWGFFEYDFAYPFAGLLLAATAVVAYDCFRIWRGRPAWVVTRPFAVFAGFALAEFAVFIYGAATGSVGSSIQARYLTPVCLALTLALTLALDRLLVYAGERRRQTGNAGWPLRWSRPGFIVGGLVGRRAAGVSGLAVLAVAGLGVWLVWSAALNVPAIEVRNGAGREWFGHYAATRWTDSPTIDYMRQAAPTGLVISNDAAATYMHVAGPARHRFAACDLGTVAEQIHYGSLLREVYVIWFHQQGNPRCWHYADRYEFSDVAAIPALAPAAELADGTVLKAAASPPRALTQYAKAHLEGATVFTNIADTLTQFGPAADYRAVAEEFGESQGAWLEGSHGDYVVWYNSPYAERVTAADLERFIELEPVAELADGIVAKLEFDFEFGPDSETYQYLRRNRRSLQRNPVFSNAGAVIAGLLPQARMSPLPAEAGELAQRIPVDAELDGARIVYWYGAPDADPSAAAALSQLPGIEMIAELADGAVLGVDREFLQTSATLRYVRERLGGARVYSNAADALDAMDDAAGDGQYHRLPGLLSNFRWQMLEAPDGAYIAWLDALSAPLYDYDYDADKLRQAPLLRVVAETEDGLIWQLDDRLGDGARYDLYYDRERQELVYAREQCPPVNRQHTFYLLLLQADGETVPDAPRYLKFVLDDYGSRADGQCVARVALAAETAYAVSGIRTGEYLRRHWPVWRLEVPLDTLPEPPAALRRPAR